MSTSWTRRLAAVPFILALVAAFAFTGCGGDDDDAGAAPITASTPTPAAASDATRVAVQVSPTTAAVDPAPSTKPRDGQAQPPRITTPASGATPAVQRLPAEKAAPAGTTTATLQTVTITAAREREVIVFEFAGDVPGYRIEYVTTATQCGSGAPVTVKGSAMISVRFAPAQAHDASGKLTVPATTVSGAGPAILEARQICDFEGVVTWVIGVGQKETAAVAVMGNRLVVTVGGREP